MSSYFITTAIDYTNAPPHIGHAYEKVLADVLARWHRLKGESVYFLMGVDQHGQKVQQTAEKLGTSPAEHAAAMTEKFKTLWALLDISYDAWAETTHVTHKSCVQKILLSLKEKGQLYKKSYKGFYSIRQEQFLTDKERNPETNNFGPEWGEVVELEEENWYFKLSEHAQWLKDFVTKSEDFVMPAFRKPELMNAIDNSFGNDLCISRPKERLHWGIEIPFDTDFVTYVWFDALINYISFSGYLSEASTEAAAFTRRWPSQAQVIGKDILIPAHGIYWPAMLHAMGFSDEEMPSLLVHGWWNLNGEKMSKTLGNVVDPMEIIKSLGVEPLRYYIVRDISTGKDSNFDVDRLVMLYNTELANDFGNLCNRSLNMTKRYQNSILIASDYTDTLTQALKSSLVEMREQFTQYMDDNKISDALAVLNAHVTACNIFIEQTRPFELAKDPEQASRLAAVLYHLLESCSHIAYLLTPILPQAAKRILEQLSAQTLFSNTPITKQAWGMLPSGHNVNEPTPVFPRILSAEEKAKLTAKLQKASK